MGGIANSERLQADSEVYGRKAGFCNIIPKELQTLNIIYHFTEKEYFEQFRDKAEYFPPGFEKEGFIHCTREPENVVRVADFVMKDSEKESVLLVIDEDRVKPDVKYERAGTETLFPHIYGRLNLNAVLNVLPFRRNGEGRFVFPA